jgi:AsmA protein
MRWIIQGGLGLVAIGALALGALTLIPVERVAETAAAQFEGTTGRKLVFSGKVSPRIWPSLGITTGPVSIANAEWADPDTPLFAAEGLSIDINWGAVLGGVIRIEGLTIDRPTITLERDAQGRENWDFGPPPAAGTAPAVPPPAAGFSMDEGAITGGSIRFTDQTSGRTLALDDVDATLSIPDLTGPFSLALTGLTQGSPLALDLKGEVFSAFAAGRVVPLGASLSAGKARLDFQGRAGLAPLAAEGTLTADLSDLAALGSLAGLTLAQPGPGMGHDQLSLTGKLTLDGTGAAYLRGAEVLADGNSLKGDLDLKPGDARPKLVGQLTAGPVVLGGDGGGSGETADASSDGWSKAPIDVSGLGALDADLAFAAPSVDLGGLKLGETRLRLTLDRARAVAEISKIAAYGGDIAGEFVVNGRGGLSVGGKLGLTGIDMQALMTDLAGSDRLTAPGDLDVQFLGVGNSVAEIMKSLKGQGAVELGRGALRGADVVAMLQTLDPANVGEDRQTAFDGMAGTFTITDGVLSNSDLKLVAPSLTAAGAGEIDLGARKLDYRLRPTALAAADGTGGVMVPLLVTGPWADLSYRLDLESIAREKMEAEAKEAAKAAEAAAKAELERRLKEELGATVAPDETLGDAAVRGAGDALEDEARKALEGILNGN